MDINGFETVLGTSYIPTDEEVLTIKDFLSGRLLQISQLDAEIAAIDEKGQALRQMRADALDKIEEYRKLISPCRRLPSDVLSEIFIHCVPEDRNPTMSADEAPMLLTRISSHWRQTALTTPQLWAAIHIAVPSAFNALGGSFDSHSGKHLSSSEVIETRLDAVATWIERSGTLPLSFSVHEYDAHRPPDVCKKFLQQLLPYCDRWQSINLDITGFSFAEIQNIPPSEVPMLQSMTLVLSRAEQPASGGEWKDMALFRAPSLTEISLLGMTTEISQFPFTWKQLTKLEIKRDTWGTGAVASLDAIISILEQCSNLVSFDVHIGSDADPTGRTQFPSISLPHLESFSIYDGIRKPSLFDAIDAPNLKTLKFIGSRAKPRRSNEPPPPTPPLQNLLVKIGGGLQELTVTASAFGNHKEAVECLLLCPSLKSLSIITSHLAPSIHRSEDAVATFVDGFLDTLGHASDAEPYICPKLEILKWMDDAHFSDQALLEFIMRKQGGHDAGLSPLKSVKMLFRRRKTVDVASLLPENLKVNLNLELQYPPSTYRGPYSPYEGIPSVAKRDPYLQGY